MFFTEIDVKNKKYTRARQQDVYRQTKDDETTIDDKKIDLKNCRYIFFT